jgi:hypothetical protein
MDLGANKPQDLALNQMENLRGLLGITAIVPSAGSKQVCFEKFIPCPR